MTKARTQAQRRRHKKAARDTSTMDIAPVKRRAAQGRKRMDQIAPDVQALEARARHAGVSIASPASSASRADREAAEEARQRQLRDLRAPWHGCRAGRAMASIVKAEEARQDMWSAIQHMRRVYAAYDASISAPKRFAKCLAILAPTEAMETDAASPPLDDRTDEEKARAARSAFHTLQGWLRVPDRRATVECIRVAVNDEPCRDPAAMVRALHCVVDGIKGRKIVCRSA